MRAEEVQRRVALLPPNAEVKFMGTAGDNGEVTVTDILEESHS